MQKDLKVVFFGTPDFVIPVLKVLFENFKVVGVVTNLSSHVSQHVTHQHKHNITILAPFQGSPDRIREFADLKPDLAVVASFGEILSKDALDIPKHGFINIHPSLLPKYRGASPIQSAILERDPQTGVTIIKMDEEMDHGPILIQDTLGLNTDDNFQTLSKKLFQFSADLLVKTIEDFINKKITLEEQDHSKASYCKRLSKTDGYFDLDSPPPMEVLDRMIRAYFPWPTAWTLFRQDSRGQAKIVKLLPGGLVQIEGKNPTTLNSFLNGYPNFPIKNLSST